MRKFENRNETATLFSGRQVSMFGIRFATDAKGERGEVSWTGRELLSQGAVRAGCALSLPFIISGLLSSALCT